MPSPSKSILTYKSDISTFWLAQSSIDSESFAPPWSRLRIAFKLLLRLLLSSVNVGSWSIKSRLNPSAINSPRVLRILSPTNSASSKLVALRVIRNTSGGTFTMDIFFVVRVTLNLISKVCSGVSCCSDTSTFTLSTSAPCKLS